MKLASIIKRWGLPVALVCGFFGFFASGLQQLVTWQAVVLHYGQVQQVLEQNWLLAYAGFFVFYLTVVAFSLPISSLMTLAAGAIIGWPAIGLIVPAATAGACLVFIAARGLFRDLLLARARPYFPKLETGFNKNAFSFLLFLRLMPLAPFWAVNIIPAFTRMKLILFITATAIGIIPGTAVYVAVGRSFEHALERGATPDLAMLGSPQIWIPLSLVSFIALLPVFYRQVTKVGKKARIAD